MKLFNKKNFKAKGDEIMSKITRTDLEEVLKYCNQEEKALLLLMYSSGLHVDFICELTHFDFTLSVHEYFNYMTTRSIRFRNIVSMT